MYKDYNVVLDILNQSFGKIQEMAKEKELSYDELKDLFVEVLADVKTYAMDDAKNIESGVVNNTEKIATEAANYVVKVSENIPAVLYGPPQVEKPIEVKLDENEAKYGVAVDANIPSMVYGPPQVEKPIEVKFDENEAKYGVAVDANIPSMVYGPPQIDQLEEMLNEDARNSSNTMEHGDEYIPGTTIWKPRDRNAHETDEEYVDYLGKYYGEHFPEQQATPAKK